MTPDLAEALTPWVAARARRPAVTIGVQGSQASGKSSLAAALVTRLADVGVRAVTLSLDDLYLGHAERLRLGAAVHPLLRTRGVPGTHDVALGHAVLDQLTTAGDDEVRLPSFDKGADDRAPAPRVVRGPFDVVLFEGWCVGLPPVDPGSLDAPVNALERDEDADGRWRREVARQLAGPYAALWVRLDGLIVLQAPGWDTVCRWRAEVEARLRATGAPRAMSDAEVGRFLETYERWARWGLEALPPRADVVVHLDEARRVRAIRGA